MIIECINCAKKFDVNSELIPSIGRTIQCGSCNHVWFFKPSIDNDIQNINTEIIEKKPIQSKETNYKKKIKKTLTKPKKKPENLNNLINKNYELTPYKSKSTFSLSGFLSYIIVLVISFIAIIIIIDTFKTPIYRVFPDLEIIIFGLFELLKDIQLFIKDLI